MRSLIIFVCSTAYAANIPLTVLGSQTQFVVSYTATSTAPCTLSASDQNGGPTVADLDTTKFANSNTDLGRTAANGFRWPSICGTALCSGGNTATARQVVIGGHDEVKLGSDGKWYSTALQVNSNHIITVTCNGGADSGTVTTPTSNIPLGSYYPDSVIPQTGTPIGIPQPTINWSDRTVKYTDPLTGVLMTRMTSPTDSFDDTNPYGFGFLPIAIDVNGLGQWTNSNNFVTNQVSGTLASTSTASAPLFAAFNGGGPPPGCQGPCLQWTDYTVTPFGKGNSGSETSEWCISIDSGQTCANFTPVDVSFNTTIQCQPAGNCSAPIPAATPSPYFAGWGGMKTAFGTMDLTNQLSSGWTMSCSGSTCTIDQSSNPGINLDRAAGSKFYLSGCQSGANTMLTRSTVNNTITITTTQTGLSLTQCSYQDYSVGIRVILKNSGTLQVSLAMNSAQNGGGWSIREYGNGNNGAAYVCSRQKVTDIAVDCDGHAQSPSLTGSLCSASPAGGHTNVYLVQDNGRVCLQSSGYHNGNPGVFGSLGWIAKDTYLGTGGSNSVIKVQKDGSGNYTEFVSLPHQPNNDRFTYTDITSSALTSVSTQIQAGSSSLKYAINSGLFSAIGIDGILDDGNGGNTIQYRITAQSATTADALCGFAWADAVTFTLKNTLTMWGTYPAASAACHFGPDGGAGYSRVHPRAENDQLAPFFASTGVALGGPFYSKITSIHQQGSTYNSWTWTVTAASPGPPVALTITNAQDMGSTYAGYNIPTRGATLGVYITCSGATGSWTGLNGSFYAFPASGATPSFGNPVQLYTDPIKATPASFGSGALTGSVTCTSSPSLYSIHLSNIINNGGNARAVVDTGFNYSVFWPSLQMIVRDGDPITVTTGATSAILNSNTQYYAKVTGAPAGNFDLYTNAALTTPATFSSLSSFANGNGYATYAETCPDPSTITLPGSMFTDTGFGTTGGGNQKVRCVTFVLANEPESEWPATNEHTQYPPCQSNGNPAGCTGASSEASNVNKSMLHTINVGDAFMNVMTFQAVSSPDPLELFYVLSVDRSGGENSIKVTVERNYGDDPNYGWVGVGAIANGLRLNHWLGWGAWQCASIGDFLTSAPRGGAITSAVAPINGIHYDLVSGNPLSTIDVASSFIPGPPDSIVNGTITQFQSPNPTTHNSIPIWSTQNCYAGDSNYQSYPSERMTSASSEFGLWNIDWMALNPSAGGTQNAGYDIGWSRTVTLAAGTTKVWKITPIGTINIKCAPLMVHNLPHAYYADMSGPGSSITDTNDGSSCLAYNAGECRPGSSAGDIFFAGLRFLTPWNSCRTNDNSFGAPCAFGLSPGAGWAVQVQMSPTDTAHVGVRRLTKGFTETPSHWVYSNWIASPDGKWSFFSNWPLQQRAIAGRLDGSNWFIAKNPPWPTGTDGINRTTYIQRSIAVTKNANGDTVRIGIGYGEYGISLTTTYCTSRGENCYTTTAASASNPFVFAGETQGRTACDPSCTVNVPLAPGHVALLRVEHLNGATVDSYIVDTFTPSVPVTGPFFIQAGKATTSGKVVAH